MESNSRTSSIDSMDSNDIDVISQYLLKLSLIE